MAPRLGGLPRAATRPLVDPLGRAPGPAIVVLVAAALAVGGCLGGGPDAGAASEPGTEDPAAQGPGNRTQDDAPADGETTDTDAGWTPTLREPPPWEPGEWWTVSVADLFTGETHTATLVVAAEDGGTYQLGLAAPGFQDALVIAHWPPLGQVDAQPLRYTVHNEPQTLADFPLEEGKTWGTAYEGLEGFTAEVQGTDGTTATIRLEDEANRTVRYIYDADTRTVTRLEDFLGRTYEVTDHGTGYEGEVVVPHGRTQYLHGRVVGALGPGGPLFGYGPGPPTETGHVGEPQASVAVLAGSVGIDAGAAEVPPPPGYYRESVTPPTGNTTVRESTGTDGLEATYLHVDEATGTWAFRHVAGGYGAAATEIVAYEERRLTPGG